MGIGIIGGPGSGKTTFLGLLYLAANIWGTDKEDDFRLIPGDHNSLTKLHRLRERFEGGHFPYKSKKTEYLDVHFKMGFRTMPNLIPKEITNKIYKNPFATINFKMYDVAGEDINDFVESGMKGESELEELFSSNVAIFLIDCRKIKIEPKSEEYQEMVKYDGDVSNLIKVFSDFKRKADPKDWKKKRNLRPIFIFSCFEAIDPAVLMHHGLAQKAPSPNKERERKRYFERLLAACLTETYNVKNGVRLDYIDLDKASYFYSSVNLEIVGGQPKTDPDGSYFIERKLRPGHAISAVFSEDEYFSLIEKIKEIARAFPDEVQEKDKLKMPT
jgi:hypothetical protein